MDRTSVTDNRSGAAETAGGDTAEPDDEDSPMEEGSEEENEAEEETGQVVTPDKAPRQSGLALAGQNNDSLAKGGKTQEAPRRSPRTRLAKGAKTGAIPPNLPDKSAPTRNKTPVAAGDE